MSAIRTLYDRSHHRFAKSRIAAQVGFGLVDHGSSGEHDAAEFVEGDIVQFATERRQGESQKLDRDVRELMANCLGSKEVENGRHPGSSGQGVQSLDGSHGLEILVYRPRNSGFVQFCTLGPVFCGAPGNIQVAPHPSYDNFLCPLHQPRIHRAFPHCDDFIVTFLNDYVQLWGRRKYNDSPRGDAAMN